MKIASLQNILLPESQALLQNLSNEEIVFPKKRCDSTYDMVQLTGDAEVVLIGPWDVITSEYLDACPTICHVQVCGTSLANANTAELLKRGITYAVVRDYGDEPAAEFTFLQLSNLLHGVGGHQWRAERHELMGKHIGIIGLGALGKSIAHLAHAYKMEVYYYSPHRKPDQELLSTQYLEKSELLKTCEIVVLTGPTDELQLTGDDFDTLQTGAILVQRSVGQVFDETGFRHWISHPQNFAFFDNAASEQILDMFRSMDNVIIFDGVAGFTHETLQRLGERVYEALSSINPSQTNQRDKMR